MNKAAKVRPVMHELFEISRLTNIQNRLIELVIHLKCP